MQPPRTGGHLVLIGGSVRAAAESAASDGWEVSAVDLFGDVDTRRAAHRWYRLPPSAEIPQLVPRLPPGPIVVTGGMEDWYEALEAVRKSRPVLAPSTCVVERLRDPAFLEEAALDSGFGFPAWRPLSSREFPRGWLVKSTRSSGGLGVVATLPRVPAPHHYVQQRVAGTPFAAAFLATGTETHLLGVTRSLTCARGPRRFLYAGSLGPLSVASRLRPLLLRLAESIRQRAGLRGLFGIDLLCDQHAGRVWVLEINPRYTASMELLEAKAGPSLISRHVACYGSTNAIAPASNAPEDGPAAPAAIKWIVWSRKAVRWRSDWEWGAASEVRGAWLSDIPQPDTSIGSGEPLVTICSEGAAIGDCLQSARALRRKLHRLIQADRVRDT